MFFWAPIAPGVFDQDNSEEFQIHQGLGAWVIGCGPEQEVEDFDPPWKARDSLSYGDGILG
jgi:hypothetical protein